MNDRLIFAYEWADESGHHAKRSISNGRIDKENYISFRDNNSVFNNTETFPEFNEGMDFVPVTKLPPNARYCYNIPVKNIEMYFCPKFAQGFNISERVVTDVLENRAIVTIDYHFEGHINTPHGKFYRRKKFEQIMSKLSLPKDRVLLLHADYNIQSYSDSNYYTYAPVDPFPTWNHYNGPVLDYVPEKIYMSHNRLLGGRSHRILFLAHMFKENMIQDGFVSIGTGLTQNDFGFNKNFDKTISDEYLQMVVDRQNTSPDSKNLANNFAVDLDTESLRRSFLSVVTETMFYDNIDFFSEKIYKPLSVGHPFILLGCPRGLKRLQDMGFRTFSKWWDESYDDDYNFVNRVHATVAIVKKLKSLSTERLVEMRHEMKETLAHNQIVFREIRHNKRSEPNELAIIRKVLYA